MRRRQVGPLRGVLRNQRVSRGLIEVIFGAVGIEAGGNFLECIEGQFAQFGDQDFGRIGRGSDGEFDVVHGRMRNERMRDEG